MFAKAPPASRQPPHARTFNGILAAALILLMIGAMFVGAIATYSAARETDFASAERQSQSALHALQMSVEELALQQETVAIWDGSASHLVAPSPDLSWVHANVGEWLHHIFRHDESYVISGRDIIKVDRAFIRDLQVDPDDGAIVHALVGLGQALKIEVVAEGIETTAQRDFLAALGCKTRQGYVFSKAVPAHSVPRILRRFGRPKAA